MPYNRWHPGRKMRIYKLINPIDSAVFYVGRTQNTLSTRLSIHFSEVNCNLETATESKNKRKISTMREIKAIGLRPIIEQIDELMINTEEDFKEACRLEKHWIGIYNLIK